MYLLLPNDPHASLTDLISRLNARTFASATGSIPSQLQFVDLSLPKFKLTTKLEEELKTVSFDLVLSGWFGGDFFYYYYFLLLLY